MSEQCSDENDFIRVFKKFSISPGDELDEPKSPDGTPSTYVPKKRKNNRLKDTHTSQGYYIQNEILEIINELANNWGGKYQFVNEALKFYIFHHHKEHYKRIRQLKD